MRVIRTYEVTIEDESVLADIAEGTVPNTTSIDLYDACTRMIDTGHGEPLYLVQFAGATDPNSSAVGWDFEYVEDVDKVLYGPIKWVGEEIDIDLD